MITELRPWHLMSVSINMRESDLSEFGGLIEESDPEKWACRRALAPGLNFTVLTPTGKPVACFGFLDAEDRESANLWMVATDNWKPYVKSMFRCYKAVRDSGIYRVIQSGIRASRPDSIKFIEWLGLEHRGTLPAYLKTGEAIEMYSYVRKP